MSSGWKVEYTETALAALRKLDKPVAGRIMDYLDAHIVGQDAPRATGKRLQGPLNGLWRYRVGDMRVILPNRRPGIACAGSAPGQAQRNLPLTLTPTSDTPKTIHLR